MLSYALRMRVARRYLISGRVQGVGFRFFTEDIASREGIHGWVRNRPDGSVEVAAEGEAEAIERFERAVRRGPRGARVERVEVDDDVPAGNAGFTIR
jgi:acylphosphatase